MIICPNCNHQNPDGATQCESCYTPLAATENCPNCGALVQSDARFCGQCGYNLLSEATQQGSPSPPEASPETIFSQVASSSASSPKSGSQNLFTTSPIESSETPVANFPEEENLTPSSNLDPSASPEESAANAPNVPDPMTFSSEDFNADLDFPTIPIVSSNDDDWTSAHEEEELSSPWEEESEPAPTPNPPLGEFNHQEAEASAATPMETEESQQPTPVPTPITPGSAATQLQIQTANLLHIQTSTSVELPQSLSVVHIGKPNNQIPPDLDLTGFPNSEIVSRIHADIRVEGDTYYIEDMGSSNGTYINHTPLLPGNRHRLRPGDRIAFGKGDKVTFVFQLS